MIGVYCSLYFDRTPRNVEDFRSIGHRIVEIYQKIKPVENVATLVALFDDWGHVSGSEIWLGYADYYRSESIKALWAVLRRNPIVQEKSEVSQRFVELCYLVDECDDIELLRQKDPALDDILSERWNFAHQRPGYNEPFVVTESVREDQRLFVGACLKKDCVTAVSQINKIAAVLQLELFSPYEAVGYSAKKIIFIYSLLYSLAKTYLAENNLAEAVRIFTTATQWTLSLKDIPDEIFNNIVDTQSELLKRCYKKTDQSGGGLP
jgi:hypothetical protein